MQEQKHISVLLNEILENLITKRNGNYFEGTLGFGGHTEQVLSRLGMKAKYVVTDLDLKAIEYCKEKFKDDNRILYYNTSFSDIDTISKIEFIDGFDGIFVDLGVSSAQFDDTDYGFTYRKESPLDLRMNKNNPLTAAEILNTFDEKEIAKILFEYGEEKNSRRIAKKIVDTRGKSRFITTFDLVKLIETIVPPNYLNKSLSRIFQALRIYINDELGVLESFMTKAVDLLNPGGRLAVISFHSLEDRIVKERMKYESLSCVCVPGMPICTCEKKQRLKLITKKPIQPAEDEVRSNFRSRSAKLRIAERI